MGYDTEIIYTWVATGLHETRMHLDADEFLTPDRVPLTQAYEMVMRGEIKDGKTIAGVLKLKALLDEGQAVNILYEDTALVVLDKPAGLTSEEGVPAALRQRWGRPDAYVGVIHRLDTGVSGADGLCQNTRNRSGSDKTGNGEPAGLCHSGRQGRGWPRCTGTALLPQNIPGRDRRRAGRTAAA